MNKKIISCLITGFILCSSLNAQTFVFHYPPCIQMFKTDYKSNRQTLQLLKKQLQTFSKGKDTLYVNGYSGECDNDSRNRRTVFHRCNNLKGYLINYYGLRERDFKTVTTTHNHPDLGDIVVISYSSLPLLKQMEEDVSKSLPAEKEQKTEEITLVIVEKETEHPETLVNGQEQAKQEVIVEEKTVTEMPLQREVVGTESETQPTTAASPRTKNARTAYRWYAGIELGMPLGVSTFTSFASAGKTGFEGGGWVATAFHRCSRSRQASRWAPCGWVRASVVRTIGWGPTACAIWNTLPEWIATLTGTSIVRYPYSNTPCA